MTTQTEKKKQAILDITFQLLNEKELKNITVDEIARKAEVSKVTLFKYYQSKNHLINIVLLRAFEFMAGQIQDIIDSDLNFEATYQAITDMKLDQVKHFSTTFQENMMTQYSTSPDFFDLDAQVTQLDIYLDLLRKGRDEGLISTDINDDDFLFLIRIFSEGMKGLTADYLFQKADLLTRFFINGLK